MKLYTLQTKGLGEFYVLADNPHDADTKLQKLFSENNYGYISDRLVMNTRLITEETGKKPFVFSEEKRFII